MTKYLIVMADGTSGRGTRGLNLYWFLSTYYGGAGVKLIPRAELNGGRRSCETLFIGLPTKLTKDDLARISYKRLVVFDYEDSVNVLVDEPRQFLSGLTDRYLKVWNEPGFAQPWKWGVLPIRRHARLPIYLKWLRLKSVFASAPKREWDVTFLGAPTGQDLHSQRVEWLKEIQRDGKDLRFWGGLAASPDDKKRLAAGGLAGAGIIYEGGRVGYTTFFDMMRRSKTVLTPKGNARWSYRHYEAIYAGAIPVSCDMRSANVLIPLPLDGMTHVADGAPVMPAVRDALSDARQRDEVRASNIAFLERWLHDGGYSRRKPGLLDRFEAQLR